MAEEIFPVDHFPELLKHFSNERLVNLAIRYNRFVDRSADGFVYDRAAKCQQECERRGLRIPHWPRVSPTRVA